MSTSELHKKLRMRTQEVYFRSGRVREECKMELANRIWKRPVVFRVTENITVTDSTNVGAIPTKCEVLFLVDTNDFAK